MNWIGEKMMYKILYSSKARSDAKKLRKSYLNTSCAHLLEIIRLDPYQNPPPFEKLNGDWGELYSRWINVQHRLVYKVDEILKIVKIYRMWTHYE